LSFAIAKDPSYREFSIPNGAIPSYASMSFVGNRTNGFGATYNLMSVYSKP
jgi:hypothetical protein